MLDMKAIDKKTEARLTDYLGIMEIRDILQQNPATADKEFAILDDMRVEVGVGDKIKIYKAIKNDEGNWELLEENKKLKTGKMNKNNPIKVEAKRVAYDIEWDIDDDEYEDEDDELSLPTEVVIPDDIDDDDIEDYLSDLTGFCHYGYKIKKLKENKKLKKESVSYNDLVRAGTDLWRDGCVVYDTMIDGIYDCTTDGHGGYLVDTTIFPELAKYGDKTTVANIVGFEEDYEALKVLWVFPQLIKSEDFKNKLNLDMVLAYDEDKSFAKEFPTMGGNTVMNESASNYYYYEIHFDFTEDSGKDSDGYSIFFKSKENVEDDVEYIWNLAIKENQISEYDDYDYIDYAQQIDFQEYKDATGNISMNENKLNEALQVRCKETYIEDEDEYWSKGNIYTATKLDGQNWSIVTNFGNKGKVGPDYMLDDFDEYFEVLKESKDCIKETKLLLVNELPDMCYGVLPSDNSIIILKKGETGYYLTNKDYQNQIAGDTFDDRYNSADELANKLNAEIDITPEQRFSMEIRSMNGNWDDVKESVEKCGKIDFKKVESRIMCEEVSDVTYAFADTIADEIIKYGVMNFEDILNRLVELSGKNIDTIIEEQLDTDVYGILGSYGIICNYSTGDFYTDEYAGEHPEVLEESKNEYNNNIANTFKNYEAFKNNFEDIIIVKSPYNKNYLIYTLDSKNDDDYIYYTDSKDNIEGWLAGAVKANNNVIKSRR